MKVTRLLALCALALGCHAPLSAREQEAGTRVESGAPSTFAALDAAADAGPVSIPDAASLPSDATLAAPPAHDSEVPAFDASQPDARAGTPEAGVSVVDDAGGDAAIPAPVASGCITQVNAGKHELTCDGLTHIVSVPAACLGQRCGLIIDVHGGTMSARMEEKNTRLAALGERHGYVVQQPNANLGLFDAASDDAKVLAFAKQLIAVFHLDPDRVHMTGFSQGGYMTWRFLCAHSDFLASAAPAAAAGEANISFEVDCRFSGAELPARQRDILYMHGTQDALVSFANAQTKRAAVIAAFELDRTQTLVDEPKLRRTRHENAQGTVFEFIEHDYSSPSAFPAQPPLGVAIVGHCYPGSPDLEVSEEGQLMAFGCTPPNAFDWGETVMEFFRAHPRRPDPP